MVASITGFIKGFFLSLIIKMMNLITSVAQDGYDGFIDFIVGVIGLFPDGPALPSIAATPTGEIWLQFLSALNWAFPISLLLSIIQWTAEGYLLFIFISPIARLFKLVT